MRNLAAFIGILTTSFTVFASSKSGLDCPDIQGKWLCNYSCEAADYAGSQEKPPKGCVDMTAGEDWLGDSMIFQAEVAEVKNGKTNYVLRYVLDIPAQTVNGDKVEVSNKEGKSLLLGQSKEEIATAAAKNGYTEIGSCSLGKMTILNTSIEYPATYGDKLNPTALWIKNTVISKIDANNLSIAREYLKPSLQSGLYSKKSTGKLSCKKVQEF